MLFNSTVFLLLFLPAVLLGLYFLDKNELPHIKITWLILASFIFYAWADLSYLLFLTASLLFNFFLAQSIYQEANRLHQKKYVGIGVVLNLLLLAYFKYYNFGLDLVNDAFHAQLPNKTIILPLAISFVTFQQIAFLVDGLQSQPHKIRFKEYVLFIVFFPQLIAGPIVYFSKMMPQYQKKMAFRVSASSLAIGLAIFSLGLFKKVVIADTFKPFADLIFSANTQNLSFIEAWGGALCYSFQLYFDFSGYSDMAIGLARMMHIRLPINFNSPYKSKSLIEFWHRWHITLSDFLKNYLYIPLGGNRFGQFKRFRNLILTMLLGGLWHGAGLNFMVWGLLHGVGLTVNHAWRQGMARLNTTTVRIPFYSLCAFLITFTFIVFTWVFFRAQTMDQAIHISQVMLGLHGFTLSDHYYQFMNKLGITALLPFQVTLGETPLFKGLHEFFIILLGFMIAWLLPNTYQLARSNFIGNRTAILSQNLKWSLFLGALAFFALLNMNKLNTFLYYQF